LTADAACRIVPKTFTENVFGSSEKLSQSPNIHEVARLSGVSVATVSRVFNGYTDVSDETRKRVLESARRLEYTPSRAARTLVRKRSEVIGVFLFTGTDHPDIQHPFFQEVLVALKQEVGAAGFDLLLFATELHEIGVKAASYLGRARNHHVDGLVLMGVDPADPELAPLVQANFPTVAVDIELVGTRAGYVSSDNAEGARLAVRHFWDLGHRRIATISGPDTMMAGHDRLVGFRAAIEELGAPSDEQYVAPGDFYTESGHAAMDTLLALPEPPTAVFVASDLMAVGAIRAIEESGRRCPEDIAVIGFDDIQLAELISPPLTTVRQDKRGLGSTAAQALVEMIEDPDTPPPVRILPVELVIRGSSGAKRSDERRRGRRSTAKKKEVA
jgi:LacI family transcriptional regulator, galactose operon repressor